MVDGVDGGDDQPGEEPPERRWATGTAYLRGQGAGQVRGVHGLDALPPQVSSLVIESRLPRPGARPRQTAGRARCSDNQQQSKTRA